MSAPELGICALLASAGFCCTVLLLIAAILLWTRRETEIAAFRHQLRDAQLDDEHADLERLYALPAREPR